MHGIFCLLKNFQTTRNLVTLMCLWGLPESTLRNLKGTNVWERINFNLRRYYLKKTLQEVAEKNLEIYFIFRTDLSRSYWRINWKIKIDIKIRKEEKVYQNAGLLIYTYHDANFYKMSSGGFEKQLNYPRSNKMVKNSI